MVGKPITSFLGTNIYQMLIIICSLCFNICQQNKGIRFNIYLGQNSLEWQEMRIKKECFLSRLASMQQSIRLSDKARSYLSAWPDKKMRFPAQLKSRKIVHFNPDYYYKSGYIHTSIMSTPDRPNLPPRLPGQPPSLLAACARRRALSRLKPAILMLAFSLQIYSVGANQSCVNITSSTSAENCYICQNSQALTCEYTSASGKAALNKTGCAAKCCDSKLYRNANQNRLCQSSFFEASADASSLSLPTILIIIFFSIPAGICLFIAVCTCVNGHRRTEEAGEEPHASAVDLAAFSLDELGPLYQDRAQSCSICLESECNLRTRCGHSYHSQCLRAWIAKKEKCPLCVTQDFNPLVLYCRNCFKQARMVLLAAGMAPQEAEQWGTYGECQCEECLRNRIDDAISLESVSEQQHGRKAHDEQRSVEKSQSHQRVPPQP